MAEVVNIPKAPTVSAAMREHSSLENGGKDIIKNDVEHKEAVILKKQTFGQKLKSTFVAADMHDVGEYILWDIVIPGIGRLINDAICSTSQRIFLGTTQTPSNLNYSKGVTNVVPYSSISSASRAFPRGVVAETKPLPSPHNTQGFHLNEWGPISRPTAETILSQAVDYIDTYGRLSVNEYYAIAKEYLEFNFTINFTAQNWGWKNLATAQIINQAGGAVIKMPNPVYLG